MNIVISKDTPMFADLIGFEALSYDSMRYIVTSNFDWSAPKPGIKAIAEYTDKGNIRIRKGDFVSLRTSSADGEFVYYVRAMVSNIEDDKLTEIITLQFKGLIYKKGII